MHASRTRRGERRFRSGLFVLLTLFFALSACSEKSEPATGTLPVEEVSSGLSAGHLSAERMAQWTRNCALCHVRGEGGAPVLGDREAWAGRWQQGEAALLEHTVEGLNNMPPLGYCMDCEREDFLALIRFMGGER